MTHEQLSPFAPALRDTSGPILRRACGCGGSCGSCSEEKRDKTIQRKTNGSSSSKAARNFTGVPATRAVSMRVGPADDAFEREADRVADAIADGGRAEASSSAAPAHVQRDVDDEGGGEAEGAQEAAGEDEEADDDLDDESGHPKLEPGASREGGVARVPMASSGGSPLPSSVRAPMESGLGHDFSSVRVHTGTEAARATSSVNARAFTVGSDIYFSPGRYEPQSKAGQHLLAHELTHVVQQSRGGASIQRAPEKKQDAPKKAPAKAKAKPKSDKVPCAKTATCDGCAAQVNKEAVHPDCGNETCGASAAIDPKLFIRHLDVNRKTKDVVAVWGDKSTDTHVMHFNSSPNASKTPKGSFTIDQKCSACHTNRKGAGMGWFTGFHNGLEFGFHNSQPVGKSFQSHGCVRIAPCDCAKEIHDNTESGTTSVCVHDGKSCKELPTLDKVEKKMDCGTLFKAGPPAPPKAKATPAPKGKAKTPAKAKAKKTSMSEPEPDEGPEEIA